MKHEKRLHIEKYCATISKENMNQIFLEKSLALISILFL